MSHWAKKKVCDCFLKLDHHFIQWHGVDNRVPSGKSAVKMSNVICWSTDLRGAYLSYLIFNEGALGLERHGMLSKMHYCQYDSTCRLFYRDVWKLTGVPFIMFVST